MSDWAAASNGEYMRWVTNIARNARITEPTGAELAAVRTFLKLMWNPQTQTGTRPWLLIEMLNVVGRNFDYLPITAAEKGYADTLITATGERRLGTGPLFGNVGGSEL